MRQQPALCEQVQQFGAALLEFAHGARGTFTVPQADLPRAQALLEDRREEIGYNRIITDSKTNGNN